MTKSKKLDTTGGVNMNMNNILYQNIISSPYFKQLIDKKTFHEVVDEIYNHEPFLKGTTASTAFCLLYKLWTLKLTIKQVQNLITHVDSPHIRALGFLYLRYVCKPADLFDWFDTYLDDDEEVVVEGGPKPRSMTMGRLCRDLLTEQKWIGTMLPRIPVPIAREIEKKLKERPYMPGRNNFEEEEEEEDQYQMRVNVAALHVKPKYKNPMIGIGKEDGPEADQGKGIGVTDLVHGRVIVTAITTGDAVAAQAGAGVGIAAVAEVVTGTAKVTVTEKEMEAIEADGTRGAQAGIEAVIGTVIVIMEGETVAAHHEGIPMAVVARQRTKRASEEQSKYRFLVVSMPLVETLYLFTHATGM
ncbi:PRP38 pre-mRNA processing factor 38 domain-containing protein B [Quaeritorhiza haematococci]|nr:PRP38 pre-mRNA processing factor 38 domain-containing protein B [Quaeritorhiza haematococci]